jgi:hypothetical protein
VPNSTATWYTVFGLAGVEGFAGVDGVVEVASLELDEEEPDPDVALDELEELGVELGAVLEAVLTAACGSGVNGLCATPRCCVEPPPVVSATAVSDVFWLMPSPDEAVAGSLGTAAVGVAEPEPPPSAA